MADTKISALTAATLPLAGTETLPIVQGGETRRLVVSAAGAANHPGFGVGSGNPRWYAGWDNDFVGNVYSTANTYYHPMILPVAATITKLAVAVTAGAAGSTCRLGIYSSENGYPMTRLVEAPTVATDSSGTKESVLASPLSLPAGTYWLATFASGNSTQFVGYGYGGGRVAHYVGCPYPHNIGGNSAAIGGLQGGSGNLAATTGGSTWVSQGNGASFIPAVFFQVQ